MNCSEKVEEGTRLRKVALGSNYFFFFFFFFGFGFGFGFYFLFVPAPLQAIDGSSVERRAYSRGLTINVKDRPPIAEWLVRL